jgi:hypothetical protein
VNTHGCASWRPPNHTSGIMFKHMAQQTWDVAWRYWTIMSAPIFYRPGSSGTLFFTMYSRSQRLFIQEVKRDIKYRRMGQPPSAQQVTLIRRDWPRISIPLYPGSTHTYNTLALSNMPNPRKFYNIIGKSISTEQNS